MNPGVLATTKYYDRSGGISSYAIYRGYQVDFSPAPAPGSFTGAVAITKVCAATQSSPDPNAVYVVFASTSKAPDAPGSACGFHTWGTCSKGNPLQVIRVPYATGEIGSGCEGVRDTVTGNSVALVQMANVAMHELAETITDPRDTGWEDSYGAETWRHRCAQSQWAERLCLVMRRPHRLRRGATVSAARACTMTCS